MLGEGQEATTGLEAGRTSQLAQSECPIHCTLSLQQGVTVGGNPADPQKQCFLVNWSTSLSCVSEAESFMKEKTHLCGLSSHSRNVVRLQGAKTDVLMCVHSSICQETSYALYALSVSRKSWECLTFIICPKKTY